MTRIKHAVVVTATIVLLPMMASAEASSATGAASVARARAAPAVLLEAPAVVPTAKKRPPGARVYERRVVRRTNERRRAQGRQAVRRTKCLNRYAKRSAKRIASNRRLTHQNLKPVLRKCGGWKVGENIAYGYRWPVQVVRAWMKSPGHRANILDRGYRRIGVGVRRDRQGTIWVSQVFAYPR